MNQQDCRYDVFLSHASANKTWVEVLARNLQAQGYRVFFDEWSLVPGEELADGIATALKDARAGVLVASPEAANSGWVGREYRLMLDHRIKHPEFVIVPVIYGDMVEFAFLETMLWVDFRPPEDYRKAFYRLLCGLKGKSPGSEQVFEGALQLPGAEAETPLDEGAHDFLDDIFADLDAYRIVLLLAQADRAGGPVISELLGRARDYYGESNVLHLTPPFDPQAGADDYFRLLARQGRFEEDITDSVGFEGALHERLRIDGPLFFLVSGFENGSDEGRRHLAGMLRGLSDVYPDNLRVLVCGSERLAELKYDQGALSMLNIAEDREWPELTVADVRQLQAQLVPENELSGEEAALVLRVCGGHPRLLRHCLEQRKARGALDERGYHKIVLQSRLAYQLFAPFKRDSAIKEKLCDWLGRDDLGPAEPYLSDNLLRRLYWKNLLHGRGAGIERLIWRCAALREAGRKILKCG